MTHLTNRTVVITGGGTGIGLAIAKRLAKDGANCVLMGRNLERLEKEAQSIERAKAIQCDVSSTDSVERAFNQAQTDGPISVLVNNAGIASSAPFHKMSEDEFLKIQDVNVTGIFRCTRAIAGQLRGADYGRVINISSIAGLSGGPYISHYCTSKHAVIGMTRSLAAEWAKTNTTVNAICPGYVRTEMAEGAIRTIIELTGASRAQAETELAKSNPQGRLLEVEEVAEIAGWLCHPDSRSINGQSIALNGGHSI